MIVHCPDCKKEISHTAKVCPSCGCTKRWHWEGMAARAVMKDIFRSNAVPAQATATPSPVPVAGDFAALKRIGIAVVAIVILGLLYGAATNLANMGDSSASVSATPIAKFDRDAVWKAGYRKGEELGAIAGHAGWGAPKREVLDVVARNHGDKSGYGGEARAHWESALKAGYKDAHQEITKTTW